MKTGPIIVLDDDEDDLEIFSAVLKELDIKNDLISFKLSEDAYYYLKNTSDQPLIIFSDINLPKENGINFKKRIDEDPQLRCKSIPFIFYSTVVNQSMVNEAYTQLVVQGFFQKPSRHEDIKRQIKIIYDYWCLCRHPNTF